MKASISISKHATVGILERIIKKRERHPLCPSKLVYSSRGAQNSLATACKGILIYSDEKLLHTVPSKVLLNFDILELDQNSGTESQKILVSAESL